MKEPSNKKIIKAREIAHAALRVFTCKGYPATSIEMIATEAGIGKSTVYEYFNTKQELFIAAIMAGADEWIAGLKDVGAKTRDPIERLHLIVARYLDKKNAGTTPEARLFIEVISQTFLQGGVFHDRPYLIRQIHERIVKVVVDYLLAGVSRGELNPVIARNVEKIAINFLAFLDGIHMHSLIEPGYIDLREQIDLFMTHMTLLMKPITNDRHSYQTVHRSIIGVQANG